MSPYRYAKDTTVSVSKSREEIEAVLRRWGADQLQWSDDFKAGRVRLRFSWQHHGQTYLARFDVQLPTEEELKKVCLDGRSGDFSPRKFEDACHRRGMVEHRELALFLKATFIAVERGIISAEQIFLAFLEGQDHVTVAERLLPQLDRLLAPGGTKALLKAGFEDA